MAKTEWTRRYVERAKIRLMVAAYYTARRGGMFRIERAHAQVSDGREQFLLRAISIRAPSPETDSLAFEVSHETSIDEVHDKLRRGHSLETPEQTYEQLWQRLRRMIDAAA